MNLPWSTEFKGCKLERPLSHSPTERPAMMEIGPLRRKQKVECNEDLVYRHRCICSVVPLGQSASVWCWRVGGLGFDTFFTSCYISSTILSTNRHCLWKLPSAKQIFPFWHQIIQLLHFIDTFHHLIHLYKCLTYNKVYGLIHVCFREIGYYIHVYPIYLLALPKIHFETYNIKFLEITQELGDMLYCMKYIFAIFVGRLNHEIKNPTKCSTLYCIIYICIWLHIMPS
jgi:hypothetical protein